MASGKVSAMSIGDTVNVVDYISFKNATVDFTGQPKEFAYRVVSPNHVVAYFLLRGKITEAKGEEEGGDASTAYAVIDISAIPFPNRSEMHCYWSSVYLRENSGATVEQIESAAIQSKTVYSPDYIVFSQPGGTGAARWKASNTTFYLRGTIDFYYPAV